jgi:hypothetical protein
VTVERGDTRKGPATVGGIAPAAQMTIPWRGPRRAHGGKPAENGGGERRRPDDRADHPSSAKFIVLRRAAATSGEPIRTPVTPEVAGSSPVAPVYKALADRRLSSPVVVIAGIKTRHESFGNTLPIEAESGLPSTPYSVDRPTPVAGRPLAAIRGQICAIETPRASVPAPPSAVSAPASGTSARDSAGVEREPLPVGRSGGIVTGLNVGRVI